MTGPVAPRDQLVELAVTDFGAGTAMVFGEAKLVTSSLSGGSHSITAAYSGDSTHDASTSSTLTQTVNQASQTVSFTSTDAREMSMPGLI